MARLRLITNIPYRERVVSRIAGQVVDVPGYRLYLSMYFAKPGATLSIPTDTSRYFKAVVDTGAGVTLLPFELWTRFADEIHLLESAEPAKCITHIMGQAIPYRLGRVRLGAFDLNRHYMSPKWTFAKLLEPNKQFNNAVLGLRSPFLMNRRRIVNTGEREWYLQDANWQSIDSPP